MVKKLEDYRYLKRKWISIVAEISDLIIARDTYEPPSASSTINGIHGKGTSSPTENIAINNIYFYQEIDRKIAEKEREKAEVECTIKLIDSYVESIDDITIKRMVDNKYRNGFTWKQVAEAAYYAPSSWYFVKQKVIEYINCHTF